MQFARICTSEQSATHIGVLDVPGHEARVGRPSIPVGPMTETEAVSTLVIVSAPAGTEVPAHNAPQFDLGIVLAVEGEVETSVGKTLIVGEAMGQRLTAFDVQADGPLANRTGMPRLRHLRLGLP